MISARARKSFNVFEMKGLRAICKLRRIDRVRNERIKEMCKWKKGVIDRAEEGVLKWFGHTCRMNEDRMVGKVRRSNVDKGRVEGEEKAEVEMDGWSERDFDGRNLSLEEGRRFVETERERREVVKSVER